MLKNIKIIKTGIDTEPFLKRVYDNWSDWDWVAQQSNIGGDKDPYAKEDVGYT